VKKLLLLFTFVTIFISSFALLPTQINAKSHIAQAIELTDENTFEIPRETKVTASIPDHFVPTAPILVYPENNSIIDDDTPGFVWIGSTDDTQMQYYQLVIDDVIIFDHIPLINHENDSYILKYDLVTGQYSLTPKNSLIAGIHTWKVIAIDTSGNSHDSVTWTFTIDTLAPVFIVINVGDIETSISAQDNSTVPSEPLVMKENNPLLKAVGEPLSQVELTISYPGSRETITIQIDKHGNWQYSLGLLPRDTIITLDFLITDQVGHISILNDLKIIIPDTGLQPDEIILVIIDEISGILPPPILRLASATPSEVRTTITISPSTVSRFLALLVALTIPLLTIIAIGTKFGSKFSLEILLKLLQALGLKRGGPPQGIVFDDQTNIGVPFATVILTTNTRNQDNILDIRQGNENTAVLPHSDFAITDENGIYRGLKIPEGKYRLSAQESTVIYPTNIKRPTRLAVYDYYKGESFDVGNPGDTTKDDFKTNLPILLVPVSRISFEQYFSFMWHLRIFFAKLNRHHSLLVIGLLGITTIISILSPTIINWMVVAMYCLVLLRRILRRFKKTMINGTVVKLSNNTGGSSPLSKTIIVFRPIHTPSDELDANTLKDTSNIKGTSNILSKSLTISNKKGDYAIRSIYKDGNMTINFVNINYCWEDKSGEINSQEISVKRKNPMKINAVLTPKKLTATSQPQ